MNIFRKIKDYDLVSKKLDEARKEANDLRVKLNVSRDEATKLRSQLRCMDDALRQARVEKEALVRRFKTVKAPNPGKRRLWVMAMQKELLKYVRETPESVSLDILLPERSSK